MKKLIFFLLLCLSIMLSGCTIVYKSTGDALIGFAEDEAVPYLLESNDVAFGCSMAESFTPFLLSFSRVTTPPEKLAILLHLLSGNCAEFDAWEEELRYLRAIYHKNPQAARDARIAQQRLLTLAASRQLTGYSYLTSAISEPGAECPEFSSENDELYWLLGLLNGIQAIMNDIASAGSTQVPLDIAAKVGRGAACLDNEKWWGTPNAIRAAIWITIPGNQPEGIDPETILKQSIQISLQQGIYVPQVLAAQIYLGQGKIEKVKQLIRHYAKYKREASEQSAFKILNEVSFLQLQAQSDKLWTQATGARTPLGRMGSFWDDPSEAVETIDIDELLSGD